MSQPFIRPVFSLVDIVHARDPQTLDELDIILAEWRRGLVEPVRTPLAPEPEPEDPFPERANTGSEIGPGVVVKIPMHTVTCSFGKVARQTPWSTTHWVITLGNGAEMTCDSLGIEVCDPSVLPSIPDAPIYVVTRSPPFGRHFLGVWQMPWEHMSVLLRLPNAALQHSGYHLKRVRSTSEAYRYWKGERIPGTMQVHYGRGLGF